MAELIVKEIINPFRKEEKIKKQDLDLYCKLIRNNKVINDNYDIARDLYSQLIDKKEVREDLK